MSLHDDFDLETRLRRIAADPQPDPPASLYRRLDALAHANMARTAGGVELSRVRPIDRGRSGLRRVGALVSLAAVLVIAVSATALFVATRGPQNAATWTLRADAGQGEWTALEWHDITATAGAIGTGTVPFGWSYGRSVVAWRGGFAMVGADMGLWLSKEGLAWSRALNAPAFAGLSALDGKLLAYGLAADGSGVGLWLTTDAVAWTRATVPFDVRFISSSGAAGPGLVVAVAAANGADPPGPYALYFTTDVRTWTQATLPSDLATASNVYVSPFLGGFVATGMVSDPNGSTTYSSGAGDERRFSDRAWISRDGLTWAAYDPAIPATDTASNVPPWPLMPVGRLGAGNGRIHSTDGGMTWLADADSFVGSHGDGQAVSDGNRIVMAVGSGAAFYLSEGDGHWRPLQQGGDVGSLPADGQPVLLPNGVLWISGQRVYFGQALSDVAPQGSLGQPTTASPGPSLPYPTSTPAILVTPIAVPVAPAAGSQAAK